MTELFETYEIYLAACNDRAWTTVAGFVHAAVLVNGVQRTRDQYVDDIRKTIAVFPDYTWEIRHVVERAPWLAVHLHDTGTRHRPFLGAPGDLSPVETDEFAMYRITDGRIAELWGTADNARLLTSVTAT
ncbi:ester cyclase [Actinoplanes sp. CA-142083]|uniref:ester cyclase n=1 Tax=Actinoplanes sp. CA-142083 TaxID=3239903 RepID=UPI003D92E617